MIKTHSINWSNSAHSNLSLLFLLSYLLLWQIWFSLPLMFEHWVTNLYLTKEKVSSLNCSYLAMQVESGAKMGHNVYGGGRNTVLEGQLRVPASSNWKIGLRLIITLANWHEVMERLALNFDYWINSKQWQAANSKECFPELFTYVTFTTLQTF